MCSSTACPKCINSRANIVGPCQACRLQLTASFSPHAAVMPSGGLTLDPPPLSSAASGDVWSRDQGRRGHFPFPENRNPWFALLWRFHIPRHWVASSCCKRGCCCKQPSTHLGSPQNVGVSGGVTRCFLTFVTIYLSSQVLLVLCGCQVALCQHKRC